MKFSTVFLPSIALLGASTVLADGTSCGKGTEAGPFGRVTVVDLGECGPTEACVQRVCVTKAQRGEACSAFKPCMAADYCDQTDKICKMRSADGQCSVDADCGTNICFRGKCQKYNTCGSNKDCPEGEFCRYTKTQSLSALEKKVRTCKRCEKEMIGQECSKSTDCKGRTKCQFGVCLYKSFHLKKATNGLVCRDDADCESNNCEVTTHDDGRITLKYCGAAKA
ncbi:hypothetical protein GTR04_6705 [Trichophyton interdigitale]|uniref:Dickkopf N-terminal cysteine-rich domain-containing protein n=1 Tax=Trichophyton interdigitale TaxID=101480 RepID=A0A9P4YJT9_9EURO|nr:hypothetical protein GY631_3646 [Trichophyton interdigitale]KAF3897514.1 hypothetical protein GY632_2222 [Trichophyton interdigitale]KAG8205917.1 hypothetical protein GTR04_6705 [Trichophyton interdigitale]